MSKKSTNESQKRKPTGRNLALWSLAATLPFLIRSAARARRYSFKDRVVIVTGGTRGLGLVLSRLLLKEGAKLVVCGRNLDSAAQAEAELSTIAPDVLAFPCDVTSQIDVEKMVRATIARFGRVDVLINNAGTIQVGPLDTMNIDDYDGAMKTHFWGPLYSTLSVLPLFRAQGGGRIVNISSVGGKVSVPHLLPYAASKFALTGFSEGLAAALRGENIFVTTVCPGLMRTGSPRNADFKGKYESEYAWFSISDSLPGITMSAEKAARRILAACRDGKPELLLGIPAKLAVRAQALFPNFSSLILSRVNSLLPSSGPDGSHAHKGKESQSKASPSLVTVLNEEAARRNNQFEASEEEPFPRSAEGP